MAHLAPVRPGLPGGHPVREPGRHRRRADHPAALHRRGLRPPRRRGRAAVGGGARGAGRRRACRTSSSTRRSMFSVFFTDPATVGGRVPATTRRPAPRTRRPSPRSSTRCSTAGVYLPPSAFEAWFLSAAHDDAALDRVVDALPRAARAAAAAGGGMAGSRVSTRTVVHLLRHGEVENPQQDPVRTAAGLPPLRARPRDGRSGPGTTSSIRPAVTTSPGRLLPDGARAADRRPAGGGAGPAVILDGRLIEAANVFEGQRVGVGDGVLRAPAAWRHLYNPFLPVVGRALPTARPAGARMRWPPPARRLRDGTVCWSAISCRSGSPGSRPRSARCGTIPAAASARWRR